MQRVSRKSVFTQFGASRRKRELRAAVAKPSAPQRANALSGSVANSNDEGILQGLKSSADLWPFAAICVTACLSLLFVEFAGRPVAFQYFLPAYGTHFDSYWVLRQKAWWIGCTILGYVALPALAMSLLPGRSLRECNFSWRGFVDHWRIYAGLYLLVLPAIWLVSLSPDFYTFYPMYGQAGRSWFDLLAWEGMYLAQFIALEFFFRGFLVGGLSKHIGVLAVPVSVMPYMMIHFSKLWPEAMASIVAGLVLGYLAWRTKSIWGGVCIHCGVAMTMDLLALAHKGQLPWLHG
jgi:membrane protease YdiL (CAAX protease family)